MEMKSVSVNEKREVKKHHSLNVDSRSKGMISGVTEVISSSAREMLLVTSEGSLYITGENLKINKFDLLSGEFTFEGKVNLIKYQAKKEKLLKRIFK